METPPPAYGEPPPTYEEAMAMSIPVHSLSAPVQSTAPAPATAPSPRSISYIPEDHRPTEQGVWHISGQDVNISGSNYVVQEQPVAQSARTTPAATPPPPAFQLCHGST